VERLTPEGVKLVIGTPPTQAEIVAGSSVKFSGLFDAGTYRLYLTSVDGLVYTLSTHLSASATFITFSLSNGKDANGKDIPAGEMLGKLGLGDFYTPEASDSFSLNLQRYLNIHNGLHSPVLATDMDRKVIWRRAYEPFGKELSGDPSFGDSLINLTFLGREFDSDLGLYQLGARWYDPELGRFISVDPVPSSLNQYVYARNNPFRYHDASGLLFHEWLQLAGEDVQEALGIINSFLPPDRRIGLPPEVEAEYWGMVAGLESWEMSQQRICGPAREWYEQKGEAAYAKGDNLKLYELALGYSQIPKNDIDIIGQLFLVATLAGVMEDYRERLEAAEGDKEELEKIAEEMYPKKAGKVEGHHWWSKYLKKKGKEEGPSSKEKAPYHQVITNLIRNKFPYGKKLPSYNEIKKFLKELYKKYPLEPPESKNGG